MPKQFIITVEDDGQLKFSHPGVVSCTFQKRKREWSTTGHVELPVGQFKFHKLVMALYKPNPAPDIFTDVDHEDGDVRNPNPNNLFWVTRQMNALNQKHAKGYIKTENGRYETRINVGKFWSLGTFDTWWEAKAQTDYYRALVLRYLRKYWDDYVANRKPGETPDSLMLAVDPYNIDPVSLCLISSNPHSPSSPPRKGRACSQRRTHRHKTPQTTAGSSQ